MTFQHKLNHNHFFIFMQMLMLLISGCKKIQGSLDPNAAPRYTSSVSGCACSVLVYSSNNCSTNPMSSLTTGQSCDVVVPDPFTRINYHCKITQTSSGLVVTDSMITPASYSFTNGTSSPINVYETNYSDFPAQAAAQLNCGGNYNTTPQFFQNDVELSLTIITDYFSVSHSNPGQITLINNQLSSNSTALAGATGSPTTNPASIPYTSWTGYTPNVTNGVGATQFSQWVTQYYNQYLLFLNTAQKINNLYLYGNINGNVAPSIFSPFMAGTGYQYPTGNTSLLNSTDFQNNLAILSTTYSQIETLTQQIGTALGYTNHINLITNVPFFNSTSPNVGDLYSKMIFFLTPLLADLGKLGSAYDPSIITSNTSYNTGEHNIFINQINSAFPTVCSKTITFVNSSTIDLNLTPQTPSSTVTVNQVTGAANISSMVSNLQNVGCLVGTQPVGLSVGSSAILNGLVYAQSNPSTTNRLFFTSNAGVIQGNLCTSSSGAPSTIGPVSLTRDITDPNKISFQINGPTPTYTFNLNNNSNQRLIPTTVIDNNGTPNTYTFSKVITSSITDCSQVQ